MPVQRWDRLARRPAARRANLKPGVTRPDLSIEALFKLLSRSGRRAVTMVFKLSRVSGNSDRGRAESSFTVRLSSVTVSQ